MQMIGQQQCESSTSGGILVGVTGHLELFRGKKLFRLCSQGSKVGVRASFSTGDEVHAKVVTPRELLL
jgi:hypothetical protein